MLKAWTWKIFLRSLPSFRKIKLEQLLGEEVSNQLHRRGSWAVQPSASPTVSAFMLDHTGVGFSMMPLFLSHLLSPRK